MQSSTSIPAGSGLLTSAFTALTIALAISFVAALYLSVRRTGGMATSARRYALIGTVAATLWLAVTGTAAALGYLSFSAPPTMLILIAATFALTLGVGFSPIGARLVSGLPIALLVGFQGFRVIVELLLHRAYTEGLMPVQMSYSGRNFDIISGITAIALGAWLASGRRSLRLIALWNALGIGLLVNILVVALLSAPTPVRVFTNEPANVWVTQAPWVWLPAVMVFAAILGHILVLRYLRQARRAQRETVVPAPKHAMLVALMLFVAAGCQNGRGTTEPLPNEPAVGQVVGSVELLGSEPVGGMGVQVSLYASLADFERRHASHHAPLVQSPASARTFTFKVDAVQAGTYYASACFTFGCGDYRNRATGELLPILVTARNSTVVNLAF